MVPVHGQAVMEAPGDGNRVRSIVADVGSRPEEDEGGGADSVVKKAGTNDSFTNLFKHTYRVLLTRGLRGCAVHFQDEQTRDFVLSRIDSNPR